MEYLDELIEANLSDWKLLGKEYVVVYRNDKHPQYMFAEGYDTYYDSTIARKYWKKSGYGVKRMYDLDYIDYIKGLG